jgi:hypothetical protein
MLTFLPFSHLRAYIDQCDECKKRAVLRHNPYGPLQPIIAPPIAFHTLMIDFMTGLPRTKKGFDAVVMYTCMSKNCIGRRLERNLGRIMTGPERSNESTGESLHKLMFGVDLRMPWNLEWPFEKASYSYPVGLFEILLFSIPGIFNCRYICMLVQAWAVLEN